MVSDKKSRSIQYSVSPASFNAVESFVMKSGFVWAYLLSAIFAPMLVPDL